MSRVVDAIFRITDEFSTPLKNFNTALTDIGRQGRTARKQVEQVGKTISNVGMGLTAGITVPAVTAATTMVNYAGEVSKSMELARATAGETAESWAVAEQSAMDAASAHTFTMEDAAEASLNFARQGYDAVAIANQMGAAMDFAQGTGTDLATTTEGLGNIMKGFGMETTLENVTAATDMMAKAQASANTNGTELLIGLQAMAPTMRTLGYDIADASALIAAWGDSGVSASEGATAFSTSMARLASPTKQAATALAMLNNGEGWSMFTDTGEAKDLVTVQRELNEAFKDMSAQEKEAAAAAIFGKNQMKNMMMIIDTAPEHFAELHNGIESAIGSGYAKELSDTMMESLGGSIESLKSSIDVLKYSLGDLIGAYVQPIIVSISEWVDKLNSLDDAQKDQIIRIVGIAAAVGPAVFAFGKLVSVSAKLMGVFAAVKAAGGLIPAVLAAITSPAAIVIGAIAGIVAIGVLLYKNWDTIKEKASAFSFIGDTINNLLQRISPITTAIGEAFGTIGGAFQGAFSAIAGAFGEAAVSIAPHLEKFYGAFDSLLVTISPIIESIGQLISELASGAGSQITTFGEIASAGIGLITVVIGGVMDAATGLIEFINVGFTGDWEAAWKAASDAFEPFEKVGEIVNSVWTTLRNMIAYLTGTFKSLWESTWTAVEAAFKPIGESIGGIVSSISGAIETAGQSLTNLKNTAAEKWEGSKLNPGNWFGESEIPQNASGTSYWQGGLTRVNESGGEIINLPSGTQIIPHDASLNTQTEGRNINIAKLADSIIVREEADIDRITDQLVRKMLKAEDNMGAISLA